jgi:hypothetical protein
MRLEIRPGTDHMVRCIAPDGRLKWRERVHNLVVNAGLDDLLDKYFKAAAYTAAWYVGLTDGTPSIVADDTMASHPGWEEITAYDEAARRTLVLGAVSGQSVDNSASKAAFTMSAAATVGGLFLCTDNTKGGASGTLYGAVAFAGGDKSVDDNDQIIVTTTLTAASA